MERTVLTPAEPDLNPCGHWFSLGSASTPYQGALRGTIEAMQVLLLEDDIDLGQAVTDHLEAAGHNVHWCKLISQARSLTDADIVLLDLNLPDGDGLSLLREWRSAGRPVPVIVLTARDQVSDRIRGLQAGADDYQVKPFDLDELLARIEAVLRRGAPPPSLMIGDVSLDIEARRAKRSDEAVELTAMEWAVLAILAGRPGRIFTRSEIESQLAVQGLGDADSNSLEVIVSRLRKKLDAKAISTHRGLGYRLDA
jgi:two-component system OmpR family response regulator